jgi:hypothetical protein
LLQTLGGLQDQLVVLAAGESYVSLTKMAFVAGVERREGNADNLVFVGQLVGKSEIFGPLLAVLVVEVLLIDLDLADISQNKIATFRNPQVKIEG